MSREKVYLETSVISYLTSRTSRDAEIIEDFGYADVTIATPEELSRR